MKVEIWSDVVCPFCYIGKRKFEQALAHFAHRDDVEVTWRSFELTPDFQPIPGESIHESLAKKKGISAAEGRKMNDYMTNVAKEVGLHYDFDRTVPAKSFPGLCTAIHPSCLAPRGFFGLPPDLAGE